VARAAEKIAVRVEGALGWNSAKQSAFVTALARDAQGTTWAACEDGIFRYRPALPEKQRWQHHAAGEGLIAEDAVYALEVDRSQRVWAGFARRGVGVCNSDSWTAYGRLNGPLGERVYDIAPSPNGDVWIGTDDGLSLYSARFHTWKYFTRAHGLPSDQISAVTFSNSGDVIIGTRCDGLAIGSRADDFKTWRAIPGPTALPTTERRRGLPSALINDVLATRGGRIYAGTNCGLAWSDDDGQSWQWVRGRDWEEKKRGSYRDTSRPVAPQVLAAPVAVEGEEADASFELLREDYVSCLAEDGAGRLLIGHWRAGWEMRAPSGREIVAYCEAPDYVRDFLPAPDGLLIASYGSGIVRAVLPPALAAPVRASTSTIILGAVDAAGKPLKYLPSGILFDLPKFPAPARPPGVRALGNLSRQVNAFQDAATAGYAAYLGEDWETRGDWMGRYGRQHAILCAAQSPTDHTLSWNADYKVEGMNGHHQRAGDGLRRWVDRERWDDERVLYNPFLGYRREAEWDDHGETYPMQWEGPDVWIRLGVLRGTHRLSLYFFNKDGHTNENRWRDYLIEVKGSAPDVKAAQAAPTLARCRVRDFWMGVYQRFVLQGPGEFWVRVGKNNSFNTIVNGVFLDRIDDPRRGHEWGVLPATGNIGYEPPPDVPFKTPLPAPHLEPYNAARSLWNELDVAIVRRGAFVHQESGRLLAYRAQSAALGAALSSGLEEQGLAYSQMARWRWSIPLWDGDDRGYHTQRIAEAFRAQQVLEGRAKPSP
jgi:hypothetical protein